MLTELCRELKNWFEQKKKFGEFTIEGGTIEIVSMQDGQYFRILGSVFNDGVYQYPVSDLTDETFNGEIWFLAIPKEVVDLSREIDNWKEKYQSVDGASMSPFTSESFGGYSYTKSTNKDGSSDASWQSAFASRLNAWRKI